MTDNIVKKATAALQTVTVFLIGKFTERFVFPIVTPLVLVGEFMYTLQPGFPYPDVKAIPWEDRLLSREEAYEKFRATEWLRGNSGIIRTPREYWINHEYHLEKFRNNDLREWSFSERTNLWTCSCKTCSCIQ